MKGLLALALLAGSTLAFAHDWKSETKNILKEYKNECRTTEIVVDEIVKNSHIKGHVKGLPVEAYDKFKVVFYVKTNRWYVHPYTYYEGQESGYSYSNLNSNGGFEVKTVRRDVPSQKLAVVVVPSSYKIVSQRFWLKPLFGIFGGVLKYQCNHTLVEGNGDFFN
ncbi:MAG: hypothetical protein ACLGHN_07260 [Bacteriovoracia bacterium]